MQKSAGSVGSTIVAFVVVFLVIAVGGNLLAALFGLPSGTAPGTSGLGYLVGWGILVLAVLGATWATWRTRRRR